MAIIPMKTATNGAFAAICVIRCDVVRAMAVASPRGTQPEAAFAATFHDPSTGI